MLLAGTLGFGETGNIFIYILGLVPLAIFAGVEIALFGITTFLSMFLFLPMIFGLILLGVFGIGSLVVIFVPIMGLFLLTLFFLFPRLTRATRALFFLGIALFLGIGGVDLDMHSLMISTVERAILSSSMLLTFILLLWSGIRYHFSELSLPGIIGTVFLLSLILVPTWSASWIVYGVFLLIGFSYPFIAHIHGESSSRGSLIGYQIVLNLFLLGELFFLGNTVWFTNSSSSLITLGIIVFVLSLASLIYSVLLMRTVVFENDTSLKGLSQEKKATVSGILAIPLSLFSLAVAVTFSETPLVVSTVWILESSVLAYFFGKARNTYILLGSLVLLAIGLLRTVPFFDAVHVRDWLALVPIGITAVSIFLGARLLGERDRELTHAYDVLHIVGIITVASACMQIIPHTSFGWSLLGLSLVLGISTLWYQRIQSRVLAPWLVILGCSYFVYHIVRVQGLSLSLGAFFIQMIALFLAWYATWIYFVHSRLGKISFAF